LFRPFEVLVFLVGDVCDDAETLALLRGWEGLASGSVGTFREGAFLFLGVRCDAAVGTTFAFGIAADLLAAG